MEELVFQGLNGQAVTNSLLVAEKFGKEHRNVIRSIKEILGSAQNCAYPLYVEATYTHPQNGQEYPVYIMTRDGFTLLAMGFTGEKSLKFKMEFINAFNKMESMLKSDDYIIARSQEILQNRLMLAQQKLQMLEGEKEMLEEQNRLLAPKASYTDDVLQASSTYTFTQMAKELNFTGVQSFMTKLKELKLIFKQSGQWQLTAKYAGKRYTTTRTARYFRSDGTPDTSVSTVWTERGRMFLHNFFADKNIV